MQESIRDMHMVKVYGIFIFIRTGIGVVIGANGLHGNYSRNAKQLSKTFIKTIQS